MTKYGGLPAVVIWPAEVMLRSNRQPHAKSCSATRTANGAPTAQPTMPTVCSASTNVSSVVW
jgi:hypothetical protein